MLISLKNSKHRTILQPVLTLPSPQKTEDCQLKTNVNKLRILFSIDD